MRAGREQYYYSHTMAALEEALALAAPGRKKSDSDKVPSGQSIMPKCDL